MKIEALAASGHLPVLPQRVALSSSIKRRFGVGIGVLGGKSVANTGEGSRLRTPSQTRYTAQ